MENYPEPKRASTNEEIKKRAEDRAARAKEMRGKGMSLRAIAAELSVVKSMVRNYLGGAAVPPNVKPIARERSNKYAFRTGPMELTADLYERILVSTKASGRKQSEQLRHLLELGLASESAAKS